MKIYKCDFRGYAFTVRPEGGSRTRVVFEDTGAPYYYGRYYCTDEKVAKAIEAREEFGNTIHILEEDTPVETEKPHEYEAVYDAVKRTQEANKILVAEYGIDKDKLTSKEDALRYAKELNIYFPNL